MLNRILDALKALSIENYLLEERRSETAELFFIRKKLDMRRIKDITDYSATVYRDFELDGHAMRGSSSAQIFPGMGDEDIRTALKDAYDAAANVRNPFFELYRGERADTVELPSRMSDLSLQDSAARMAAALFAADTRDDAFLNSSELFIERAKVRLVSSAGTDVGYIKYGCKGEFVAQCKQPRDVEQYFDFSYEDLEEDALTAKVAEALKTTRDRAKASKSPKAGEYDIVLTGENLREIMVFYLARAQAGMVFAHYSDYAPGKALQGEEVRGEKLNLTLVPSAPYSDEGIPMRERALIQDGVLQLLFGPTRFCRYLDIEPTGDYWRIRLDNGTVPFDEMKKNCLYPVSFSDFQMDPMDSHFSGEIRLAYLYTDDGVQILTGGSINGSLLEKQGDLVFSTERYTDASYSGPLAIRLKGVSVSGE